MPHIIRPGLLTIPSPEHREINGHHYSIAPLLGRLATYRARGYAERIMEISAADMARSPVARALVPDKMERLRLCGTAYNPKNDKRMDALGHHIATKPAQTGTYVLAIGIFDNHTADPQAPSSMVGYTELSLTTGHKGLIDTYLRTTRPDAVVPSLGEGVLLDPAVIDDEQPLEAWAVPYALGSVRKEDIGVKFTDGLLLETSQEALDINSSWLTPYGEYVIRPSKLNGVLGETPVTVQFDSLKNIVKTT